MPWMACSRAMQEQLPRVLSVPFASVSVRQPTHHHGQSVGHRLSRHLHTHYEKSRLQKTTAHTGAVTLIQRFGSALNLNVHLHMLFLDGVYVDDSKYESAVRFQWIQPPTTEELARLTHTIAKRIGRYLERQGLLERDADHGYLNANTVEDEQDPMHQLHGSSVTYRVAVGPRQGRKVFTLQTMPPSDPEEWVGKVDGFSLR